jgi:mannitol operon transcriptional antiterminator
MRYISARERSVLIDLLNPNVTHTLTTLSKKNNVSTRTIRRDLATITMLLRDYQLGLDTQEETIRVLGDAEHQAELLQQIPMFDYSSVERTLLCFADLLDQKEHIKMLQLQQTLEASPAIVIKAMDELEAMVQVYGAKMDRKRSAGILIQASEESLRYVSFELVLRLINQLNVVLIFEGRSLPELIHPHLHNALNRVIVMDQVHTIIQTVSAYYKGESIPRDDQIILEIAVYTAVVLRRATLEKDPEPDGELAPAVFLQSMELSTLNQLDITRFINARLNQDLLMESNYESKERFELFLSQLLQRIEVPVHMIHWFYDDLHQWFNKNTQVVPTTVFSDELLVEVLQGEYPEIYAIFNEVVTDILPIHHTPVSLAEGFVVFISRLEQLLQQIELKVLVVCIGGMGSSRMITTRLRNQFPRLVFENISLSDTSQYDPAKFDFIVSTVQTSLHPERTIRVSPLLFESDILKIKHMIRKIGMFRPHIVTTGNTGQYSTIFMLRNTMLDRFAPLIIESVEEYFLQGIVDDVTSVIQLIMKNEIIGFGIPETKIAIYHARSSSVKQQVVEIVYSDAFIDVPSMNGELMPANTHVFMVSTEQMTEVEKQLFNTISVMLSTHSEFISVLQTKDIQTIEHYINHNMIGEE